MRLLRSANDAEAAAEVLVAEEPTVVAAAAAATELDRAATHAMATPWCCFTDLDTALGWWWRWGGVVV